MAAEEAIIGVESLIKSAAALILISPSKLKAPLFASNCDPLSYPSVMSVDRVIHIHIWGSSKWHKNTFIRKNPPSLPCWSSSLRLRIFSLPSNSDVHKLAYQRHHLRANRNPQRLGYYMCPRGGDSVPQAHQPSQPAFLPFHPAIFNRPWRFHLPCI